MTSQQRRKMKEIDEMRQSGLYPVASLEIFDTVADIKMEDFVLEREQEILEKYKKHLDGICSLKPKKQENYLKGIKNLEQIDTQIMEQEDYFLVGLSMQSQRKPAIDYLLTQQRYPLNQLTKEEIIVTHRKLLEGTSGSQYARKDYRTNNLAYVTKSGQGPEQIHYFFLPCEDIECGLMNLTIYYNSQLHDNHTFLKPILIHGLTGALQMFDDGNTRMGRLLQNIKIYELTELNLKIHLSGPALYSSRSYLQYREQYRNKLADIVIEPSDETWNTWLKFNLNRLEDQIFYMDHKLEKYMKLSK